MSIQARSFAMSLRLGNGFAFFQIFGACALSRPIFLVSFARPRRPGLQPEARFHLPAGRVRPLHFLIADTLTKIGLPISCFCFVLLRCSAKGPGARLDSTCRPVLVAAARVAGALQCLRPCLVRDHPLLPPSKKIKLQRRYPFPGVFIFRDLRPSLQWVDAWVTRVPRTLSPMARSGFLFILGDRGRDVDKLNVIFLRRRFSALGIVCLAH